MLLSAFYDSTDAEDINTDDEIERLAETSMFDVLPSFLHSISSINTCRKTMIDFVNTASQSRSLGQRNIVGSFCVLRLWSYSDCYWTGFRQNQDCDDDSEEHAN